MSIALTNVGIVDRLGLVCKGTDPSGAEVRFKVTRSEMTQLAFILFGDLAINFTGITVEQVDIITEGT